MASASCFHPEFVVPERFAFHHLFGRFVKLIFRFFSNQNINPKTHQKETKGILTACPPVASWTLAIIGELIFVSNEIRLVFFNKMFKKYKN